MINTVLPPLRPVSRHISRIVRTRCSRCGAYAHYDTATGSRWCVRHWRQHALVELAQQAYMRESWWLQGAEYQASELVWCVRWILDAEEWKVQVVHTLLREGVA